MLSGISQKTLARLRGNNLAPESEDIVSKIEELRKALAEAEKADREDVKIREEEFKKVCPKPKYEHIVHLFTYKEQRFGFAKTAVSDATECLRFNRKLLNKDEIEAMARQYRVFPANCGIELEPHGSVTYFVFHGVLCHDGGGTCYLYTPQLCSPEQWEMLKQGQIFESGLLGW